MCGKSWRLRLMNQCRFDFAVKSTIRRLQEQQSRPGTPLPLSVLVTVWRRESAPSSVVTRAACQALGVTWDEGGSAAALEEALCAPVPNSSRHSRGVALKLRLPTGASALI
ncbi:hypothetical protein GOBAR_AA03188 [Gossypium barbadense]|uniref:Uncharacterized protein n=1 Tax=Gossypium barbadense TaxID=3634 RepID=A0A2P5YP65_GOSBA|nr:hypothetical protein GOBAR_AA03188 [Gossypium barbadense]